MKVKTSASSILNQLRVITKLVPPSSSNITLQCKGNNLHMYSMNDVATYESIVPCDIVEGDEAFGVNVDAFRTILTKRGDVELTYVNTMLVVTDGKYRAELSTTDPLELQVIALKEETSSEEPKVWKVDVEQGRWLRSALSEVALKPVEALSPFMPVTVKITDKGGFVVCYDASHMAFIRSKDIQGDLYVTMPCDLLSSVFDSFSGSPFKMEVTESRLVLRSKLLKVSLSLPVSDSYMEVEELLSVANATLKEKGDALELDRDDLLSFMDSCKAVATKERSELKAKAKGKKLSLQVRTETGNVNQVLPLMSNCDCEFNVDFVYLEEALRKHSSSELSIKVIKDSSLLVGTANGSTVISLND